ncbi:AMP-binding protein [Neobacillus jeddahensis]|uniref:AMP-binding protein n=1 Tax=Neobacillus jeddahensis TaxID=1461580 RepID=UPI00059118E2|nr:AMP-binding protein [Neobacillus jeddahensis]
MSVLTDRLQHVLASPKPMIHDQEKWYVTTDIQTDIARVQDCLASAGVLKGERILLSYANSYHFVCLYLAIIDYGAIVVPINPNMPEYELISFIQRSRPVSGFMGSYHADILLKSDFSDCSMGSIFVIDTKSFLTKRFDQTGVTWLESNARGKIRNLISYQTEEDSLAVLLYTSGTTGNPKAVGLTHGQILAAIENIIHSHELSAEDITYCFLPLFHINAQVVAVLSTFLSNGKIVIAPKFSASKFWNVINEHSVTWVSAVPAVISILLNSSPPQQISSHLRFIRSASSQLPMVNARRFEQRFHVPVIQSYGMTEAASQICVNPLPPRKRVLGSVGLPVGVQLKIVDSNGQPCLPTKVGEIVIKGDNVIHHYIEAANQNDFLDGWFHTGDLGYVDKEGYVFIVGRMKEMINRGGEKISPYEVEDVIRQIPEVKDAAVIGLSHPLYGEIVVSYITCQNGQENPDKIVKMVMAHCQKSLSNYKWPAEVYIVDEIPVGPTGKIQRNRLKELNDHRDQNLKTKNMR